jgi:MFS family permease
MGRLLLIGMVLLAGSLAVFPSIHSAGAVLLYAGVLGVAGGIITVVYFAIYGHAFGRAHLGAIQATVQVVSVFASALGPVLLTSCKSLTGSYAPLFYAAAPVAVGLGLLAWLAPLPRTGERTTEAAPGPAAADRWADNGATSAAPETVTDLPSPERSV